MGLIPENVLQEIRERVDIVELAGETVQLKRRGKNFVGLCPFHREKTPSFNVNPERQIFKCFGCGVGGDALVFLMSRDNLQFPEAARRLAARAGIELPPSDGEAQARWQRLYEANAFAAEFYERALRESPDAEPARSYLAAREVGEGARATFRLGWAPAGWDGLLAAARAVGLEEAVLLEAGLVSRSDRTGGLYDRFRSRVAFPIQDASGRVVGFSGRLIAEEGDAPKYLNSPETPVFRKGALLFGLALTKNAIRRMEEAIVVEGNFDLLSLYDRGLTHAVAPLGTALTPDQAFQLKRYASRAVLLYDSDEAGLKAAFRSGDELLARGFSVRLAFLPAESDPDAFVRREGAPALRELLREAPDLIAAKLRVLRERLDLSQVEAKRRSVELLLRSIRRIPDAITRELQIAYVAGELGVDPGLLADASAPVFRPRPTVTGQAAASPPEAGRLPAAEKYLLLILLKRPEFLPRARPQLAPEDLTAPAARRIYELLLELDDLEPGPAESTLMNRSDPEMQSVLSELWLWEESLDAAEKIFADTLAKVKELAKERELAEVHREGAESEAVWRLARARFGLEGSPNEHVSRSEESD